MLVSKLCNNFLYRWQKRSIVSCKFMRVTWVCCSRVASKSPVEKANDRQWAAFGRPALVKCAKQFYFYVPKGVNSPRTVPSLASTCPASHRSVPSRRHRTHPCRELTPEWPRTSRSAPAETEGKRNSSDEALLSYKRFRTLPGEMMNRSVLKTGRHHAGDCRRRHSSLTPVYSAKYHVWIDFYLVKLNYEVRKQWIEHNYKLSTATVLKKSFKARKQNRTNTQKNNVFMLVYRIWTRRERATQHINLLETFVSVQATFCAISQYKTVCF